MRKLLLAGAAVVAGGAASFGLWYFRPWSDYSPARVIAAGNVEDRTQSYRAMTAYFPYRTIEGVDNAPPLPRDLVPMTLAYNYKGVARTVEDYARDYAITGLMIVKDDRVVYERYWRDETAEDRHTSWSVAKSVVATLVGMALKEGQISHINDTVETYAPVFRGTDYGRTTIRELLMMSSGIDFEEDYEADGSDMRKLFFNVFILNKDVDRFVRVYRRDEAPGTEFEYLSPNTTVLGAVVSGAYGGRSLSSLASEKIFAPMGMADATWLLDRNRPDGKELAYCCINMRLEDYARFGLLYLHNGIVGGQALLPDGWTSFVQSPPTPAHQPGPMGENGHHGYGHHFWIPPEADGAYFAAGYNGQAVWIYPKANVVLAVTAADRTQPANNHEALYLYKAAIAEAAALGAEVEAAASMPISGDTPVNGPTPVPEPEETL